MAGCDAVYYLSRCLILQRYFGQNIECAYNNVYTSLVIPLYCSIGYVNCTLCSIIKDWICGMTFLLVSIYCWVIG